MIGDGGKEMKWGWRERRIVYFHIPRRCQLDSTQGNSNTHTLLGYHYTACSPHTARYYIHLCLYSLLNHEAKRDINKLHT